MLHLKKVLKLEWAFFVLGLKIHYQSQTCWKQITDVFHVWDWSDSINLSVLEKRKTTKNTNMLTQWKPQSRGKKHCGTQAQKNNQSTRRSWDTSLTSNELQKLALLVYESILNLLPQERLPWRIEPRSSIFSLHQFSTGRERTMQHWNKNSLNTDKWINK